MTSEVLCEQLTPGHSLPGYAAAGRRSHDLLITNPAPWPLLYPTSFTWWPKQGNGNILWGQPPSKTLRVGPVRTPKYQTTCSKHIWHDNTARGGEGSLTVKDSLPAKADKKNFAPPPTFSAYSVMQSFHIQPCYVGKGCSGSTSTPT